jgi:hypothetical protein
MRMLREHDELAAAESAQDRVQTGSAIRAGDSEH